LVAFITLQTSVQNWSPTYVAGFAFVCVECRWFTAEILEDSPGCKCLECRLQ